MQIGACLGVIYIICVIEIIVSYCDILEPGGFCVTKLLENLNFMSEIFRYF